MEKGSTPPPYGKFHKKMFFFYWNLPLFIHKYVSVHKDSRIGPLAGWGQDKLEKLNFLWIQGSGSIGKTFYQEYWVIEESNCIALPFKKIWPFQFLVINTFVFFSSKSLLAGSGPYDVAGVWQSIVWRSQFLLFYGWQL